MARLTSAAIAAQLDARIGPDGAGRRMPKVVSPLKHAQFDEMTYTSIYTFTMHRTCLL